MPRSATITRPDFSHTIRLISSQQPRFLRLAEARFLRLAVRFLRLAEAHRLNKNFLLTLHPFPSFPLAAPFLLSRSFPPCARLLVRLLLRLLASRSLRLAGGALAFLFRLRASAKKLLQPACAFPGLPFLLSRSFPPCASLLAPLLLRPLASPPFALLGGR